MRVAPDIDVVLADNHRVISDALTVVLTQSGYRVIATATTCAELVDRVGRLRPAICVTGNRFSDGAAVDAIEALLKTSPETRVVLLTGQADADTLRRALDAGAAGYVHKSRGTAVLMEILRRVSDGEIVVEGSFRRPRRAGNHAWAQPRPRAGYLTRRELECLALLADGQDTDSMAALLGVSRTTVRSHVQAVLTKLGAHTRLEAASVAIRQGLIVSPREAGKRARDGWR